MQATAQKTFIIKTTAEITEETVSDLLCCAFEGGVGYWCRIMGYEYPEGKTRKDYAFQHIQVVLDGGTQFMREDMDDSPTDEEWHKLSMPNKMKLALTREKLGPGLQVMADKYPWHFKNVMSGDFDAETGDVFLQCCLYGKIVFS
jgi:hypothetical protein